MSAQYETREIALNKLVLWEGNVRKTGADSGIEELAASIKAHGLLNPLTIQSGAKGTFVVIAGGRRLAALKMLAKMGDIEKTAAIPCRMPMDNVDSAELSLAENVVRVAMHPADQFETWRDLVDNGQTVPQIAARFGVSETVVRKRLSLGKVSPVILEAYRQGETDLEALQAFTVTDDRDVQESVWAGLSGWQKSDARTIRQMLTQGDVPTHDRRVRFVGLDAYEAAGGSVKRDLFAAEGGGYCTDVPLLDRLFHEKLQSMADTIRAEGWKWAEGRVSFGWEDRQAFEQADPEARDEALENELEELESICADLAYSSGDGDLERYNAAEQRIAEIEEMPEIWSDAVKASSGVIITVDHQGEAVMEFGLIRAEDAPAFEEIDTEAPVETPKGPASLPASLIEDLTAHKTAALRIELARSPDVALAAVVHAIALSAFYADRVKGLKTVMVVRSLERSLKGYETVAAVVALEAERERIGELLPGNASDLWEWCLSASRDDLMDVLAVAAAYGVDTVVTKTEQNRSGVAFGAALAKALDLNMANWYSPSADGYFGRISKTMILSDLEAARGAPGAPGWEKLKKTELAILAEREVSETDWLPELLR
ncbi:ParB/RepB/Spo0J family partition protein [Caballeronia sp. TF1N1]|uniref:ParB/RepB/Spo0J family partition protein n=1 Tax=Caballeronia sp. TF1N1 TaxID=2878153 RepID=UPI001FD0910C|nr:ParB/RepB/Spo0J family partition protein [Caballeronia sp. TF1N1]